MRLFELYSFFLVILIYYIKRIEIDKMKVLLIQIGIIVIVLIIGFFIWSNLIRHNRKRMPGTRKKKQIFKQINHWKIRGYNYDKRLKLLIGQGYDKSVANILLGEVEYMSNPNRDRKPDNSSGGTI